MLVHPSAQGMLGLCNIAFLTVLASTTHPIHKISSFLPGYPVLNPYEFLSQGVPRMTAKVTVIDVNVFIVVNLTLLDE